MMLSIIIHQESADSISAHLSIHIYLNGESKKKKCETVKKLGHTYISSGNVKWYSHYGKQSGSFLKKTQTKMQSPYDLAIVFSGNYPKEKKTHAHM